MNVEKAPRANIDLFEIPLLEVLAESRPPPFGASATHSRRLH
jgi:hypothetical protein